MTNFGPTKEDLWNEFNNLKSEKFVNFTRDSIMRKIYALTTDITEKKLIEKELSLTHLFHSINHHITSFNIQQNEIDESICQFRLKSGNEIDFYKKRLSEVTPPLLKAHYSFACFILEKKLHMKNMFNFIVEQLDYLLEHPTKSNLSNTGYLLKMIYNLNNFYNLKFETQVNDVALKLIKSVKTEPKCLIDVIETLSRLRIIKDDKLDEVITFGISVNTDMTTHLKELLLNSVISLCNLDQTKYEQTKKDIILKIAQMLEKEAVNQESALVIFKLEEAREYYIKLNDKEKINEINAEILKHTQTIDYDVTKYEIKSPGIEIKGNFGFERVKYIANYPYLIPKLKDIEKLTEDLSKQYPIAELFTTKYFDREKPISENSEIPQKIIHQSIQHIQIGEIHMSEAVRELERTNLITANNYLDFLESFGFYDETSLEIIMIALERHFQDDFVSSIHSLIPQVELTLRGILEENGIRISKANRAIKYLLLKELIDECGQIFDENVIHYLKIKYGEPEAMNQRNIISHGFSIDISDFNHPLSLSLIYILMRLLVLKPKFK